MKALTIITADERLREQRGAKVLIIGVFGVGKTSLLRTLDVTSTLFIDIEGGDLAVIGLPVDTIRLDDWPSARDLACRIAGSNPSFGPNQCYSAEHYRAIGGPLPDLEKYSTFFIDSITALSRLSFRHAEQQPEAFTERGRKDVRGAYGLHAREMLMWLNHLQHARDKNVIFVGVLERSTDEFGRPADWQLQSEGQKTGKELPGIVDQIVTMSWIDFGDGSPPTRAFVCTSPNAWNYPAKDRSGRLEQIEPPDLGRLLAKLTQAKT
jgi:hypothetical protein